MAAPLERVRNRARHEHARLVLAKVVTACATRGIDVLPVKGAVTAYQFYDDPGERPIQDVDLRVRARDLDAVVGVARAQGWPLLWRSPAYETLAFDVLGFLVEFESHVGPPGLCGLEVDAMLRRAERAGSSLRPELHDHALLLCVNAFKDKLVHAMPGAVRDLELVTRQPGFDPARFAALARDAGSTNIAWHVATFMVDRGAAEWSVVRAHLGSAEPRPIYARLFRAAMGSPLFPRLGLRILARVGADRPAQQARAVWGLAAAAMESAQSLARRPNVRQGSGIQHPTGQTVR